MLVQMQQKCCWMKNQYWVAYINLNTMSALEDVAGTGQNKILPSLKKAFALLGMSLPWMSLSLMRTATFYLPETDSFGWCKTELKEIAFAAGGNFRTLELGIRICDSISFSPEGKSGILFLRRRLLWTLASDLPSLTAWWLKALRNTFALLSQTNLFFSTMNWKENEPMVLHYPRTFYIIPFS